MSKEKRPVRRRGQPAIEMIEEAVRLLRRAPAAAIVAHLLGAAPCLLYGLYFFTDLSRNPFAAEHVIGASCTFAALYCWMKCWQAVGVAHLNATLLAKEPPAWTTPRVLRLVAAQVFLQPIGLVLRLCGGFLVLPYVWPAVFCQNVSVLGDGTADGLWEVVRRAFREAIRWPLNAHGLAGLLGLLGFFIYLNSLALLFAGPMILKTFFGIETVFTRYSLGLFNPTTLLALLAFTYLLLDPIRKAAVLLRCFHGRSLHTGEDLAVEIHRIRGLPVARVLALVALLCLSPLSATVRAEPPKVEAAELDRSIDEVLARAEFTWRAPRAKEKPVEELNGLQRWLRDARKWAGRIAFKCGRILRRIIDAIFNRERKDNDADSRGWMKTVRGLFWVVLAATVVLLAVLIVRRWRSKAAPLTLAEAIPAAPDLREDNVTADQLPEDRWLQLAAELFERGELRLALRAFFLAGLAHLAGRELLQLARHKSNHDYERELRRRARTRAELLAAFDRNRLAFERAWYGDHAVTSEVVQTVSADFERIRAC